MLKLECPKCDKLFDVPDDYFTDGDTYICPNCKGTVVVEISHYEKKKDPFEERVERADEK